MRRENSKFNTAFISYEGSRLFNNDYYGSAELDGFACYVVADGLETGDIESESARIAVQAAIAAFHERPSMSKRALKRYMRAAHRALRENTGHVSLRASMTVVVTNYQTVRYAWAGNTRFYLYRAGRLLIESADHSLARQLADRGELPVDKIALHEERNNLSLYLGQPGGLNPKTSKKIKLQDGDIITLLTRGIWENCDPGDIRAALDSSEGHPQLAVEGLERLMLSPAPEEIDNYTIATVFIDKVFIDPNKGKKLKLFLMIAIPVLLILIIITIVLIVMHNDRVRKEREMQTAFLSAVEYIGDNNYPRASEDLDTALTLAIDLNHIDFQAKADAWKKLTESVLNGDELFAGGDYIGSQEAYLTALDRSRFTDNAGQAYLERKLASVGSFLSVRDLIALGDTLADDGQHDNAEDKYTDARRLASGINDAEGRQTALDALQALYEAGDENAAAVADAAAEQTNTLREATDMEVAADEASAAKDFASARLYYGIAQERFTALLDDLSVTRVNGKLVALDAAQAQIDGQATEADGYAADGDALYDAGDYVGAKVNYILARNIYSRLNDEAALNGVLAKIELCDSKINNAETEPSAEPTEAPTADPATGPIIGPALPEESPAQPEDANTVALRENQPDSDDTRAQQAALLQKFYRLFTGDAQ